MARRERIDDEREALIDPNISLYRDNDSKNYRIDRNIKTPSLLDVPNNKCNINRKPSRLEWAESSWTRWIHVVFWSWLNPILNLGYKTTLTDDDLDDLPRQDKCSVLWKKLLIYNWSETTTWRIIFRAFGKETFYQSLIVLPFVGVRLAQSLFVWAIVKNINQKDTISSPILTGIMLAIGLYLSALLQGFLLQHLLFRSVQLSLRIRNALSSTIYQHLLSISLSSFQETNTSQTINLIANDASKFGDFWLFGHFLWAAPLEAIITFGLLYQIIGVLPTCFGFIILLPLIPMQLVFSRQFSRYHQKTVACADKRINIFSEVLDGCQVIKMYNWEKPMGDRVRNMHEDELSNIKLANHLRALNMTLFFVAPCLIAMFAFGGIWLLGYQLQQIHVFTALAFFGHVRLTLTNFMPWAIERLSAMLVASKRIDVFMRLKTREVQKRRSHMSSNEDINNTRGTIVMDDATFSWDDNKPCLSSLNISIKAGQLAGIIGSVGSGKSSLLLAILGEMKLTSGDIRVKGSLSYAAQSSWIFADTIRANIVLGNKFDTERYTRVIHACCLDIDFKTFGEAGDLTVIGDKGVNLSGGQKARVSLARALYVDADIYLLDDPLAAVDPKVAKRIFDVCIGSQGLLSGKTRLLVTHQTHLLTNSDQCILLADGHIQTQGSLDQSSIQYEHVIQVKDHGKVGEKADNTEDISAEDLDVSKAVVDKKSILQDETFIGGDISWFVWRRLFTTSPLGWFGLFLLIILLLIGEILYDVTIYWLVVWSSKSYAVQQKSLSLAYIFFGLALSTLVVGLVRADYWFYIMLRGTAYLHDRMLHSILHTSLRFFESNPSGRILSRASRDQQLIDTLLPVTLFDAIQALLIVAGSVVIIGLVNPLIFLLLILVLPVCWYLRRYYMRSNRQLKQLESVTYSPIYALFSSSLNGVTTIGAFGVKEDFMQTFIGRIDANTRAYLTLLSGIHWYGLRLDFIAALFVLMTAVLVVTRSNQINASLMALSLICSLNLVGRFQWAMRQFAEVENYMISAERIDEYSRLPVEEDNAGNKRLIKTSLDWPNYGGIEFRKYTLHYRPGLAPVLNNINIRIEPGEKVGIIGRTGK